MANNITSIILENSICGIDKESGLPTKSVKIDPKEHIQDLPSYRCYYSREYECLDSIRIYDKVYCNYQS